jgi:hypothetical protein
MNRAIKNKVRGNQRAAPSYTAAVGYPKLLAVYNDKANLEAGTIDQRVIKPLQPDGMLASWNGSTPPN